MSGGSDDKVYGDPETATNTEGTVQGEENPPDTASGGAPEPAGDDDE